MSIRNFHKKMTIARRNQHVLQLHTTRYGDLIIHCSQLPTYVFTELIFQHLILLSRLISCWGTPLQPVAHQHQTQDDIHVTLS